MKQILVALVLTILLASPVKADTTLYLPIVGGFSFKDVKTFRLIDTFAERTQLCQEMFCHEVTVEFDDVTRDNCKYPVPNSFLVTWESMAGTIHFDENNGLITAWVRVDATYTLLDYPADFDGQAFNDPQAYTLDVLCYDYHRE